MSAAKVSLDAVECGIVRSALILAREEWRRSICVFNLPDAEDAAMREGYAEQIAQAERVLSRLGMTPQVLATIDALNAPRPQPPVSEATPCPRF